MKKAMTIKEFLLLLFFSVWLGVFSVVAGLPSKEDSKEFSDFLQIKKWVQNNSGAVAFVGSILVLSFLLFLLFSFIWFCISVKKNNDKNSDSSPMFFPPMF